MAPSLLADLMSGGETAALPLPGISIRQ